MFNTNSVLSFYNDAKNPEHRYHSFDYCYDAFARILAIDSPSEDDIDIMALNLGMYLASWGMYRGSSELLQSYSYKVHIGAVRILLDKKYRKLYKLSPTNYTGENISLILEVFDKLFEHYNLKRVSPTDTLITKILLGTLGCTMALDTRVKASLGQLGITHKFSRKHLVDMKKYYDDNKSIVDEAMITINNPKYHILKCMDMSFF